MHLSFVVRIDIACAFIFWIHATSNITSTLTHLSLIVSALCVSHCRRAHLSWFAFTWIHEYRRVSFCFVARVPFLELLQFCEEQKKKTLKKCMVKKKSRRETIQTLRMTLSGERDGLLVDLKRSPQRDYFIKLYLNGRRRSNRWL